MRFGRFMKFNYISKFYAWTFFKCGILFICCLAIIGCGDSNSGKPGLMKRWVDGVKKIKEDDQIISDLVDFFSYHWHAVSFQVMAEDLLESRLDGRKRDSLWPFGKESRPYGRQEQKARIIFQKKFGLEPPFYFPPALEGYSIIAPPWAKGTNLIHWEKVIKQAGIETIKDLQRYLENRKYAIRSEIQCKEVEKVIDPIEREILLLLCEYPGSILDYIDKENRYMEIRISDPLASGTDGACQAAAELFLKLCSVGKGDFILKVTNDYVPSSVNPMDAAWARTLAGLTQTQTSKKIPYVDPEERISMKLKLRGIKRK